MTAGTRTLPYAYYSEPAILAEEQRRIFAPAWHYVGHAGELPSRGSFKATHAGTVPIVLVRDEQDTLRALLNVCRHRGALVCDGAGTKRNLQCPYHAWTYGLDGRLLRAPRLSAEDDGDTAELGLLPLRLERWGALLFVCTSPQAPPLAELLGDLPARVAAGGVDVDALRFVKRSTSTLEANWKIVAENFLECYHCPVVHPGLIRAIDVSEEAYQLEAQGPRLSQECPVRAGAEATFEGAVSRGQFHLLFPGTILNIYPGRQNLSIGPLLPRAPARTERFLDYFVGEDADDAWFAELLALDDQVGEEDRALVERVQRGVTSGLLDAGRLMPRSERLIAHFQALVARALAGSG